MQVSSCLVDQKVADTFVPLPDGPMERNRAICCGHIRVQALLCHQPPAHVQLPIARRPMQRIPVIFGLHPAWIKAALIQQVLADLEVPSAGGPQEGVGPTTVASSAHVPPSRDQCPKCRQVAIAGCNEPLLQRRRGLRNTLLGTFCLLLRRRACSEKIQLLVWHNLQSALADDLLRVCEDLAVFHQLVILQATLPGEEVSAIWAVQFPVGSLPCQE
mmetsp:Transcript_57936/g.116152  ORF Transcript_57936/g.116152 Transcript_57936/m.116152 type:complete len:216 (-) Transcript_57936:545-1192(-)